ncbi:MAG: hypothetical protein OEZ68_16770 [Gammaproteobacteria bacterium]|nr:hypothetical protein [Gammaproteobacteria bacterium]MDH5802457.1 hypothetical protein [Gammaproteobacteria bacterium]
MIRLYSRIAFFAWALLLATPCLADSYRYLHVSIDTPWMIFIFLLLIILFPFVLMAILYWYFAFKKPGNTPPSDDNSVVDADPQ